MPPLHTEKKKYTIWAMKKWKHKVRYNFNNFCFFQHFSIMLHPISLRQQYLHCSLEPDAWSIEYIYPVLVIWTGYPRNQQSTRGGTRKVMRLCRGGRGRKWNYCFSQNWLSDMISFLSNCSLATYVSLLKFLCKHMKIFIFFFSPKHTAISCM